MRNPVWYFASLGALAWNLAIGAATANAQSTFTLIADTAGELVDVAPSIGPSINRDGTVAFRAYYRTGGQGIVIGDGQNIATLVPPNTISSLGSPAINDAGVVALGRYGTNQLYKVTNSTVTLVGQAPFNLDADYVSINTGGDLAFPKSSGSSPAAIGKATQEGVSIAFSTSEPVTLSAPDINASGAIAFSQRSNSCAPTCDWRIGIVDGATAKYVAVSGPEYFGFGQPSLDDAGYAVFTAHRPDDSSVILRSNGESTSIVAAPTNIIRSFSAVGVSPNGTIAFLASDVEVPSRVALYVQKAQSIRRLIAMGDTLDGAVVSGLRIGTNAVNDNGQVAFRVVLGNRTAIFRSESTLETDAPPPANAGANFSVNEGQAAVMLQGSGSDADGDALTYSWEQVVDGSPLVALTGASTTTPTFTAPVVAVGGETLTFTLTVTANGESATDSVSVTVVNVNHPPVAEAGPDQSIAEGSPVTLAGGDSFDIDTDTFTYSWVQVSGPAVALAGANTANPTFTAPYAGSGGGAGVVATLVFTLTVADGYAPDAPAPGYELSDVEDTVTVEITNTNNAPTAAAGADQTVDENAAVVLSAGGSTDPDSDPLTFAWAQVGGPPVVLAGAGTAAPSFTAPFVSPGGLDVTFSVTANDGYGGTAADTVVVHVQNVNDPPLASAARPTIATLWPPNHQMVPVGITGVADPNNNATITITGVTQDEPTTGQGDGDTAVDAVINPNGTVLLRAERSGNGDGRVYRISFTASDLEGSTTGVVFVTVPHNPKKPAIDSGVIVDSTQ